MAKTSTAVNACDVVILMDDENGLLKDVSGSSNEINMSIEVKTGETKVFGSDWPIRKECGRDATLELTAVYTQALNEARDILNEWVFGPVGGPRTIQIDIPQSGSGNDRYYGEWTLESYEPFGAKADEAAPIMVKASFKAADTINYVKLAS